MIKLLNRTNTAVFVGVLTLWRGYVNATLPLHPDETYYWLWSRHLGLSYYDHPAMVAYFIKATTLFSCAPFWVRLSGVITALIASVLIWKLAKQMFDSEAAASGSVLMLNAYPLMMSGTVIITPDVPSFLFCSLAAYYAWQVFRTQKAAYWYVTGLFFGLSLLSKYTSVLFACCLFLFMILTDERKWLKTAHPYLAGLLASLFVLPILIWNNSHDWVSLKFQMGHGLGGNVYSLSRVAEYIGGQMLVIGPLGWLAGMWAAAAFLFRKNKAMLFLSLLSLPVIIFFGATSLKNVAGPNWPALAYFTFALAFSAYFLAGGRFKAAIWWIVFATTLGFSTLAIAHARFGVIPMARLNPEWAVTDATNWFYGWDKLGEAVGRYDKVDFILTPSHQLSSEIEYWLKESKPVNVDTYITRFNQYNLWPSPVKHGVKMLYVSFKGEALDAYKAYIPRPDRIDYLTVSRPGLEVRTYRIVYGTCDLR